MWHGGGALRVRRGAARRSRTAARVRQGVRRACGARRVAGRDGAGEGGGNLRGGLRAQADAAWRYLADVAGGGAGAPPRRDASYQFGLRERRRDGGPGGAGGRYRRPPCSCWAGSLPHDGRRRSRNAAEPAGPWLGGQGGGGRLAQDRHPQAGETLAAPCEFESAGVYSRACSELPLQYVPLVLQRIFTCSPNSETSRSRSRQEGTRRRFPHRLSWG